MHIRPWGEISWPPPAPNPGHLQTCPGTRPNSATSTSGAIDFYSGHPPAPIVDPSVVWLADLIMCKREESEAITSKCDVILRVLQLRSTAPTSQWCVSKSGSLDLESKRSRLASRIQRCTPRCDTTQCLTKSEPATPTRLQAPLDTSGGPTPFRPSRVLGEWARSQEGRSHDI